MALQPASRAEVLFGVGVQITEGDVRATGGINSNGKQVVSSRTR